MGTGHPPQPPQPRPAVMPTSGGMSHLELIRQGVKLRKVQPMKQEAPKPSRKDVDPNGLSMGEILERLAEVREAVASASDSDDSDEEESTQSEW